MLPVTSSPSPAVDPEEWKAVREPFQMGVVKPRVSVLIPARNESRNLPWVLGRLPAGLHEVILVDGHSTDDTVAVAQECYPGIRVVTQRANGKGSAVVTGMLEATGDIIVMIDADGSMDPIEINVLVGALLSGADVVKSSRYLSGGGSEDISRLRDVGNRGLNVFSKVMFRHKWSELCYGYAAFWADVVPLLDLEPVVASGDPSSKSEYGRGFEIESLLFIRSFKAGLVVAEVPSIEYPRRFGESNLQTFRDGWRVLSSVVRERFTSLNVASASHGGGGSVMVVGSGSHFLSGISHYTHHLCDAFSARDEVSAVLMRRLVPKVLYPGRDRVGDVDLSTIRYSPSIPVFDGIDWNSPASVRGAQRFIRQVRPRVVVLQWWTVSSAFAYLVLAREAKRCGAKVVIEFHEIQDVGEARVPFARSAARNVMSRLMKHVDGVVVHSSADVDAVRRAYRLDGSVPVQVIHHGPFESVVSPVRRAPLLPGAPLRLLYFGVMRPYKGLDVLTDAFELLLRQGVNVSLTVVGEPWPGNEKVLERLRDTPLFRGRVTIVDRYVADREVQDFFAHADVLTVPYRRASASGPIAVAMAAGIPIVTTDLVSLTEVTDGYGGAIHVPVNDPEGLAAGIVQSASLVGEVLKSPLSWESTVDRFEELFTSIGVARSSVPVL